MNIELPEDLTADMEVLFVKPYSPEETLEMRLYGATDERLKSIFKRAEARDPGFANFENKVGLVKTVLGLGGYILGDDLIVLHGERTALQKAQESLKGEYTCFTDTIGAFLRHLESDNAVVTIEAPKPVLN
jgi:hypothetical protein